MMDRRTFLAGTAATAAIPVAGSSEVNAAEASLLNAFDRIERAVTELEQILLDNSADAFPAVDALGRAIGSYSTLIRQRQGTQNHPQRNRCNRKTPGQADLAPPEFQS